MKWLREEFGKAIVAASDVSLVVDSACGVARKPVSKDSTNGVLTPRTGSPAAFDRSVFSVS